jgi:hypothetical protein
MPEYQHALLLAKPTHVEHIYRVILSCTGEMHAIRRPQRINDLTVRLCLRRRDAYLTSPLPATSLYIVQSKNMPPRVTSSTASRKSSNDACGDTRKQSLIRQMVFLPVGSMESVEHASESVLAMLRPILASINVSLPKVKSLCCVPATIVLRERPVPQAALTVSCPFRFQAHWYRCSKDSEVLKSRRL